MTSTDVALKLIKQFEGCKLAAYPDPGTGGAPWTIGWGSTGPDIKKGVVWTQAQADARLASDVTKFMSGVKSAIKVPVADQQLGALTSFAYNVGLSNFCSSTLLKLLNSGDYAGAAAQFDRWTRASGKVLKGLVERRAAERAVFERVGQES